MPRLPAHVESQVARAVLGVRRRLEEMARAGCAVLNVDELEQPYHDIVLSAGLLNSDTPIPLLLSSHCPTDWLPPQHRASVPDAAE